MDSRLALSMVGDQDAVRKFNGGGGGVGGRGEVLEHLYCPLPISFCAPVYIHDRAGVLHVHVVVHVYTQSLYI